MKAEVPFCLCSLCSNKALHVATDDGSFTLSDASKPEKVFGDGSSCFVFEYAILPVIESYYMKMVKIRVSPHVERFHFNFSSINYWFSSIPLLKKSRCLQ